MKILYRQAEDAAGTFLTRAGIAQCYFKHLLTQRDSRSISPKQHHHTHYELHLVQSGSAHYEAEGESYLLKGGDFLLIPPGKAHRVVCRSDRASTLSVTFRTGLDWAFSDIQSCVSGRIAPRITDNIHRILAECDRRQQASAQLIAGNIYELLILLWRQCGVAEAPAPKPDTGEDPRLTLARQFIRDNIDQAPTVSDMAAYCHLSPKQMTRLFEQSQGETPTAYIRRQRVRRIEELLLTGNIPLGQISEQMHFSSEYYFNAFFKKHAGTTPGAFRAMHNAK